MRNWQATVPAQYQDSPVIMQLIGSINAWIDPAANIASFLANCWLIDTAIGYGLDVWGRRVGVQRVLAFGGANYALSDDAFRALILAKAAANICDGSIRAINAIIMGLFPGSGDNYVIDGANMTMQVHLAFAPSPTQSAMLAAVLPKPAGVFLGTRSTTGPITLAIGPGASATTDVAAYMFGPNTASASGGTGPYSYAWTETDDAAGTWALSGSGTQTVTPSVSGVATSGSSTATVKCTVTDSASNSANQSVTYTLHHQALTLALGAGSVAAAPFSYDTFGPNTAIPSGGSGSYAYAWTETDDGLGAWSLVGAATSTCTPSVTGVGQGVTTAATLHCTVTDTVTSATASASVGYSFDNTSSPPNPMTVSIGGNQAQSGKYPHATFHATAVPSGGAPPYTYAWREADDGFGVWSLMGATNAVVTLQVTGAYSGYTLARLVCAVTDSTGQTATSNTVSCSYTTTIGGGHQ